MYPDFSDLCADPAALPVVCPASRPLPHLVEPASLPPFDALELVAHPRVSFLAAYAHAGFPNAQRRLLLAPSAAAALCAAAATLPPRFSFTVFDGWRSRSLQRDLHRLAYQDTNLPPGFVADPDASTPPHATGFALDVTLAWDDTPLALGTPFDAFTPFAATAAFEPTPGLIRDLRRLLVWSLTEHGFSFGPLEWWHAELSA